MKKLIVIILILACNSIYGQGYNHNYLIGDDSAPFPPWTIYDKGIIKIDSMNFNIIGLSRKMRFFDTQSNIANDTGAVLFYTNGCWIANAMEDTMLNGSGLSPDPYVAQTCLAYGGLLYPQANIILPYPGDSTKYVLFHHGGSQADPNSQPLISYYSVIDMTLDGGLGGVIAGQKNMVLVADSLNIGFAACKHANGRDWWVVIIKGKSNLIYKVLLTDQGVQTAVTQSLGVSNVDRNTIQPVFSPDGSKFAYNYYDGQFGNAYNEVRIFDFDRCTGNFSNPQIVSWGSGFGCLGLAFSSNSKYLYTVSDFDTIHQINTDTSNLQSSMTVVAINDGYYSPVPPLQSNFWTMYLAANGKILISSGSTVIDLHYINYPDSAGIACDVQLHALHMPCLTGRSNVNHPNYYLGCDTTLSCPCLITGLDETQGHDFMFSVSPNPSHGSLKIVYMLPQNKSGKLEVFDMTGRMVYSMSLSPWSTLQMVDFSHLQNGLYNVIIDSENQRTSTKLILIKP